jgi:hypothetical protein
MSPPVKPDTSQDQMPIAANGDDDDDEQVEDFADEEEEGFTL